MAGGRDEVCCFTSLTKCSRIKPDICPEVTLIWSGLSGCRRENSFRSCHGSLGCLSNTSHPQQIMISSTRRVGALLTFCALLHTSASSKEVIDGYWSDDFVYVDKDNVTTSSNSDIYDNGWYLMRSIWITSLTISCTLWCIQTSQQMHRSMEDHPSATKVIRIYSDASTQTQVIISMMAVGTILTMSTRSPFHMNIPREWIQQILFSSKSPTIWIITTTGS